MKLLIATSATILTAVLILAGCAAPVSEPENRGFLSDYSKLEMIDEGNIIYISDRAGEYLNFVIDPVTILFERDPENQVFSDKEIEDLKQHLVDELTKQLTKGGYVVRDEAAPGVARIRIGITDLDDTIGLLNVSIYTKITGLGLGGVSVEGEVVDSMSGEQIAAAIRWGSGSRVMRAGLTHTGDAKIAIDKWAKDFREHLDEINGR